MARKREEEGVRKRVIEGEKEGEKRRKTKPEDYIPPI